MKMIMKNRKLIISIALIVFGICTIFNSTYAIDPEKYNPNPKIEGGVFTERAGIVLGWIQFVGILFSIVSLSIIGIKYLFSSVEGKAEYKKTMLPYVVGCFLIMGISLVIGLIEEIAKI